MYSQTLTELIEDYPKLDVRNLDADVLVEIADRWLRAEYSKRVRATARQLERTNQRVDIVDAALANAVNRIARDAASRIINEWAPSLLAQTFTLPNGRTVRWGEATAAEHEARASQLEKHASGVIQTAALHRRALSDIQASGGKSLNELTALATTG